METRENLTYTAFLRGQRVATGELGDVVRKVKEIREAGERDAILVFDDVRSELMDLDLNGTSEEVLGRLEEYLVSLARAEAKEGVERERRGPGRPRLGVVAREVTLLPRHWEWLNDQPGGASVALRKLVEEASRTHEGRDRSRRSQEAVFRFMSAVAGDLPGFEEATRALFSRDAHRFAERTACWPRDLRDHAMRLAEPAWIR